MGFFIAYLQPSDMEQVEEKFFQEEGDAMRCLVEFDGKSIGYVQFYKVDEEEKRTYGYDDSTELRR